MKKIILSSILVGSSVFASIYTLDVVDKTTGEKFQIESSDLIDTIDNLDEDVLKSKLPGYTDSSIVSSSLDMRGLPVTVDFIGNSVVLKVPSLDIEETFNGTTRDDSIDELDDWFKKNGSSTLEKMMKELAKVSPVDPIAGNSNSSMYKAVESDFTSSFMNIASHQKSGMSTAVNVNADNVNTISISPSFKSLEVDGKDSKSYSLPLEYSIVSKEKEDQKFTIKIPLSYTDVEGAKSYNLGLGFSYSHPVTDEWIISPSVGYNIAASKNLATLAQIGNVSLASSYTYTLPNKHRISIGNMVGYYTTLKFYDGDYAYNPGISNVVFRNALMYSMDTDDLLKNTSVDLFAINTQYTGTELYNESYNEFGFSYGYNKINVNVLSDNEAYAYRRDIKFGFSYLTSKREKGFKVNFGFIF